MTIMAMLVSENAIELKNISVPCLHIKEGESMIYYRQWVETCKDGFADSNFNSSLQQNSRVRNNYTGLHTNQFGYFAVLLVQISGSLAH